MENLSIEIYQNQAKQRFKQKASPNVSITEVQLRFKPVIIGSATVRFSDRRRKIDKQTEKNLVLKDPENGSFFDWKNAKESPIKLDNLLNSQEQIPNVKILFEEIPEAANSERDFKKLSKDLKDFLFLPFRR